MPNKNKSPHEFNIITPTNINPRPNAYEETVAKLIARKFKSDVKFIACSIKRTPDIQILNTGEYWEIKNIRGNSKYTIEDNLRKASKQSANIIISLLRSKMTVEHAVSRIQDYLKHSNRKIKRVLLITKKHKIVDFPM